MVGWFRSCKKEPLLESRNKHVRTCIYRPTLMEIGVVMQCIANLFVKQKIRPIFWDRMIASFSSRIEEDWTITTVFSRGKQDTGWVKRQCLPKDEHNDWLDGGRLELVVGVPNILQGDPIELPLVDIRHLEQQKVRIGVDIVYHADRLRSMHCSIKIT